MSLKTVRQGKNECSIVMYHPCSVSEANHCVACVQHYALHLLVVLRSILKQDVLLTAWRLSVYLLAVYLILTSCMCTPVPFVYSLQCTAECGNFHLTVTITVFHGTIRCFIVFCALWWKFAHWLHTRNYILKITDVFASKLISSIIINESYFKKYIVQYSVFCDACM